LLGAEPPNARKPDGKLIGLHRIKLLKPDPSLTQINRYRYKRRQLLAENQNLMAYVFYWRNRCVRAAAGLRSEG
jgi:hypothetical protein